MPSYNISVVNSNFNNLQTYVHSFPGNSRWAGAYSGAGVSLVSNASRDYALQGGAYDYQYSDDTYANESFLSFDCSVIPAGETIVSASLMTINITNIVTKPYLLKYDYGSSVDISDWRTPSQLQALPFYASATTLGYNGSSITWSLIGSTLLNDIASRGIVKMLFTEYNQYNGIDLGDDANSVAQIYSPNISSTGLRPYLQVITTPAGPNYNLIWKSV